MFNKTKLSLVVLGVVSSQAAVAVLTAMNAPSAAYILPAVIGVTFIAVASRMPKKAMAFKK